jgi:hypothetical protein
MASIFNSGIDISLDYVVNIRWYMEGVILLVIGALGVIGEFIMHYKKKKNFFLNSGNIISLHIIIWTQLGFKRLFRQLISALLIFDTICIFCNIATFSGPFLSETYRHQVRHSVYGHSIDISGLEVIPLSFTNSIFRSILI